MELSMQQDVTSILKDAKRLHFVGIGGSGMFPLVEIMKNDGFDITGSDVNEGSIIDMERKLGIDVSIASPDGYKPNPIYTAWSVANAESHGSKVTICSDPLEACKDADVLYTDVWASMGQEGEAEARRKVFAGYQINSETLSVAKKDCIFLHCLPAHRGEEVSADVIDGRHSVVFDEAENRLHAQKAVMSLLMGGGKA